MSGTEAGRRLVRIRDLHTPDCPRWSAVGTPDARCTCILPEMIAAIEAEAETTARIDEADNCTAHSKNVVAAELERIRTALRSAQLEHFESCGGWGCADERAADLDAVLAILDGA